MKKEVPNSLLQSDNLVQTSINISAESHKRFLVGLATLNQFFSTDLLKIVRTLWELEL